MSHFDCELIVNDAHVASGSAAWGLYFRIVIEVFSECFRPVQYNFKTASFLSNFCMIEMRCFVAVTCE